MDLLKKYNRVKELLQWLIYVIVAALLVGTIVGVLTGTKSCKSNDTIETVEAKYFMNELVLVHNNFYVKVNYAKTVESISYIKKKDSNEKETITGNFIEVNLEITKISDSTEKDHTLDTNDFKLRNHSGIYLPLNDIMALFNIDAIDVHIDTDEKGFIMSDSNFDNKKAVKDFSWVGTTLSNGDTINIILFFEMNEGYKVEENLMLLEIDFYVGRSGIKKGEDIVLLNCLRNKSNNNQ